MDPTVFVKHLHQILQGCAVENFYDSRDDVSPFPRRTVNTPFTLRDRCPRPKKDQTTMVACPTDMHVVPTEVWPERAPIVNAAFEEQQMQRVPRLEKHLIDRSILTQLGRRSFMRPSICEDFGPSLPVLRLSSDNATTFTPLQRITLDRSDHVIIHIPGDTEVPTGEIDTLVCVVAC